PPLHGRPARPAMLLRVATLRHRAGQAATRARQVTRAGCSAGEATRATTWAALTWRRSDAEATPRESALLPPPHRRRYGRRLDLTHVQRRPPHVAGAFALRLRTGRCRR